MPGRPPAIPPAPPAPPGSQRPDPLELGEEIRAGAEKLLDSLRRNDPMKTTTDLLGHLSSGLQALDSVLRQPLGKRRPPER